ncbi:MAG: RNA polymerase sigma factor [Paenibacillaceae bacterium]
MDLIMEKETVVELQEKLKRYCLFLTENHWAAEDLAQETWVKALSTMKLNDHSNPQALLLRIAKNSWVDHTRRRKFYLRYMENEKNNNIQSPEPDHRQLEVIFQAIMKHMTPLQRAVFLLKDVYEYSIIETAQILNTTQGAVKAALHRARQSIEGIKRDLEGDSLAQPLDEGFQSQLCSLAAAYQIGDITKVLALAMEGAVEASTALVIAHNQIRKVKTMASKEGNIQGMWQTVAA